MMMGTLCFHSFIIMSLLLTGGLMHDLIDGKGTARRAVEVGQVGRRRVSVISISHSSAAQQAGRECEHGARPPAMHWSITVLGIMMMSLANNDGQQDSQARQGVWKCR
jgi:hypothetical protein